MYDFNTFIFACNVQKIGALVTLNPFIYRALIVSCPCMSQVQLRLWRNSSRRNVMSRFVFVGYWNSFCFQETREGSKNGRNRQ